MCVQLSGVNPVGVGCGGGERVQKGSYAGTFNIGCELGGKLLDPCCLLPFFLGSS